MRKSTLTILQFLFVTILAAQHTVRIKIDRLPYEPKTYDLFIAGSFNGWNPQDEQYKFKKDDTGNYFIDLKLNPGKYEYKITRGGWDKV